MYVYFNIDMHIYIYICIHISINYFVSQFFCFPAIMIFDFTRSDWNAHPVARNDVAWSGHMVTSATAISSIIFLWVYNYILIRPARGGIVVFDQCRFNQQLGFIEPWNKTNVDFTTNLGGLYGQSYGYIRDWWLIYPAPMIPKDPDGIPWLFWVSPSFSEDLGTQKNSVKLMWNLETSQFRIENSSQQSRRFFWHFQVSISTRACWGLPLRWLLRSCSCQRNATTPEPDGWWGIPDLCK